MTDYEAAMQDAILEAVYRTALEHSPDKKQAIFDSHAITMAALQMIAFVVHTSNVVATAAGKRKLCDEIARRLQILISAHQKAGSAGLAGMQTVHLGEMH